MDRQTLLHYVAPCSLFCYTCPGFKDGAIAEHAKKLSNYFTGYYDFNDANLPEQEKAWLGEFARFYQRLEGYAQPSCSGCRSNPISGAGCIPGCVVPACAKERRVDFCADCPEFPCQKAKDFFAAVNGVIGQDWERGTFQLREVGIENYFNQGKEISHYNSYQK